MISLIKVLWQYQPANGILRFYNDRVAVSCSGQQKARERYKKKKQACERVPHARGNEFQTNRSWNSLRTWPNRSPSPTYCQYAFCLLGTRRQASKSTTGQESSDTTGARKRNWRELCSGSYEPTVRAYAAPERRRQISWQLNRSKLERHMLCLEQCRWMLN